MNLNNLFQGIFPDSLLKVDNNASILGKLSKDKSFESFFSSAINSFNNNSINYPNSLINPLTQKELDIPKIESYFNFSLVELKDLSILILNYIENAFKCQYAENDDQTTIPLKQELQTVILDPQTFSTEITDRIRSFLTENLKKLNLTEEEINRIISDVETIANQIIPLINNTLIIDNIPQSENQDSLSSKSDLAINEPKGKTIADIKSFLGAKISQDKTINTIPFDKSSINNSEQLLVSEKLNYTDKKPLLNPSDESLNTGIFNNLNSVDSQTINSNNYDKTILSQSKVNTSLDSQTEKILSSAKEIQITQKVFNLSELSSGKENVSNKLQSDDFNLSNSVKLVGTEQYSVPTKNTEQGIITNSKASTPNLTQPPLQEEGVGILESIHASGFDKGMSAKGNIPLSSPVKNEAVKSGELNIFTSPEVIKSPEIYYPGLNINYPEKESGQSSKIADNSIKLTNNVETRYIASLQNETINPLSQDNISDYQNLVARDLSREYLRLESRITPEETIKILSNLLLMVRNDLKSSPTDNADGKTGSTLYENILTNICKERFETVPYEETSQPAFIETQSIASLQKNLKSNSIIASKDSTASETVGKPIQTINDIKIIPTNANNNDKAAATNVSNNTSNDNGENTEVSNSQATVNKVRAEKGSPQFVTNTIPKAENVNPKAVENPLGQSQPNLFINTSTILDKNKLQIEPANNDKLVGTTQTIIPNPKPLSSQSPVSSPQPQASIDIINQIVSNLQNYHMRIEDKIKIKLEPEQLGQIELELTVKDGKSAILNITTVRDSVKEAIQQNISQLKEGLNKLNIKVESFNVNVNAQSQNNHHQLSQAPLPVVNNFTSIIDTPDKQNDIPKEGNVKITHNGRLHIII